MAMGELYAREYLIYAIVMELIRLAKDGHNMVSGIDTALCTST